MPITTTRVSFGLYALEIKQDSQPAAANLQPFSKISDLKTDSATERPYATWEPDYWLLNGQYKFLPGDYTTVHVGLMTQAMSGVDGAFAVPPVLTVTFGQVHDTDGFAIRFNTYTGDYCDDLTVAYYDATNTLIRSDDYEPEGPEFSTGQAVEGFKKIVITFRATNRPHRYLRVTDIAYGELISFEGSSIKEAHVVEECDPLSGEVRYNTLDLRLYSQDADFSIINPAGYYAALSERQPLAVYATIDYARLFIGNFYLDEWESLSDTEYLFRAVDLLGLLDRQTYRGGMWLGAGIALEDLLEDVLAPVYAPYELDSALYGTIIRGWVPICTYREALQQIAFAAGAAVTCSRSGSIRITTAPIATLREATTHIPRSTQSLRQSLSLRSMVTGVEVTAHNYVAGNDTRELYNGDLDAGVFEITFPQPMHTLSISGATITESGVNYARVNVAAPGTVVLSGKEYTDARRMYSIATPGLSAGVRPNILQIDEATLVNQANVAGVAERVYAYYQQRYRQTMTLYAPFIEPAQVVLLDALYSKQLKAGVEKMELDLTGGFAAEIELIGVEHVSLD